jgi:trehalose/maltose transport system substrate-binding protein
MSISLKKAAAQTFLWAALAILFAYSLQGPKAGTGAGLTLLMEPDGTGVFGDLVNQFNREYPGPPVRMIEGPPATDTREDMYSTSFLSGDASYDIVYCDGIWVAKFAAAGWLRDLSGKLSDADRADFLPGEIRAGSYRGKLYRMPAYTDAGVLFYRKDLVPKPPETFQELFQMASALQTPDRWGFLWQGKQYEGLVTVYLEVLRGYGGEWIDDETGEVKLDSPQAVEALNFLKSTVGTSSPPAVTTYTEEDTRIIFQNGRAVFLRNWPYVWTLIQKSGGPLKDKVGIAPVVHSPGEKSAATLGGWGFGISSYTRDPERAWRFVEFMTRPEQLRQVQERQGRIPARRSLVPPEMLRVVESGRPRPSIPEYAQASDILQRWLSSALTGRVSSEQAIQQAAKETSLLLGD